jgi:hypothetical protein
LIIPKEDARTGDVIALDVCDSCGHLKSSLKAERLTGGVIRRTCECPCHPPTESIRAQDLRQAPWTDPGPVPAADGGWG